MSKFLLGATGDKTLIFAEYYIQQRKGRYEFSAMFDEVEPIIVDNEVMKERAESLIENYDSSTILGLLKDYDCTPSELSERLSNEPVENLIDISLFSDQFDIHGNDVYFESCGCGQMDVKGRIQEFTDKTIAEFIIKFHAENHLKEVLPCDVDGLDKMFKSFNNEHYPEFEKKWIQSWLKKLYEENELRRG